MVNTPYIQNFYVIANINNEIARINEFVMEQQKKFVKVMGEFVNLRLMLN